MCTVCVFLNAPPPQSWPTFLERAAALGCRDQLLLPSAGADDLPHRFSVDDLKEMKTYAKVLLSAMDLQDTLQQLCKPFMYDVGSPESALGAPLSLDGECSFDLGLETGFVASWSRMAHLPMTAQCLVLWSVVVVLSGTASALCTTSTDAQRQNVGNLVGIWL